MVIIETDSGGVRVIDGHRQNFFGTTDPLTDMVIVLKDGFYFICEQAKGERVPVCVVPALQAILNCSSKSVELIEE